MKKRGKTRVSLFQRILSLSVLSIVLPMLLFELYSFYIIRDIMEEQASIDLREAVSLTALSMEDTFKNLALQTITVYADEAINDIAIAFAEIDVETQYDDYVQLQLEFAEYISQVLIPNRVYLIDMELFIWMVSAQGEILANFSYDASIMEQALAQAQQDELGTVAVEWLGLLPDSSIYRANHNSEDLIVMCKSMNYILSDNAPMMYIAVREVNFRNEFILTDSALNYDRFLVGEDFQILSCADESLIGENLTEYLNGITLSGESGVLRDVSTQSGMAIVSYQKVSNTLWTVVDVQLYDEMLEEISAVNHRMLVTNLAIVAVFLLMTSIMVGRVTKPLRMLQQRMREDAVDAPLLPDSIPQNAGKEVQELYETYAGLKENIVELLVQNETVERNKRVQELAALQAQIKPHFLFNTLMSIRSAINNENLKKASDMTLALSKFMRSTIVKVDEVVSLRDEIENIRNYIDIQNMRSYQTITLELSIAPTLLAYKIPNLLLQPLVENAIIHGFESMDTGQITITGELLQDGVCLSVRDNGRGFVQDPLCTQMQGAGHFGVYNVNERIQLYYGAQYTLQYRNDHGTVAVLQLPQEWGGRDV